MTWVVVGLATVVRHVRNYRRAHRSRGVAYTQTYRNCKPAGILILPTTDGAIPQPWARIDGPAAMPNDENSEKQVFIVVVSALVIMALVFLILLHVIQIIY